MSAPSSLPLKAVFVISQDSGAGAPRAVHRIYKSIRQYFAQDVDVRMRVIHKSHDDEHIIGGKATRSKLEYLEYFIRTRFRKYFPRKAFVSANKLLRSQALYHSGLGRELNAMKADVIMLGWLGNSTLSIPEIGKLQAPVVWRLSDMWMFSGAEHYTKYDRYVHNYSRVSRPSDESGPDIDRETYLRKKRHWKHPRHVIAPSQWMADQVKLSGLTKDWPVHVIQNPIDTDYWKPRRKSAARRALGLPNEAKVILFGTGGGTKHHHKGGDLLLQALEHLDQTFLPEDQSEQVMCAIFGEERPDVLIGSITVKFLGRLDDDGLMTAYSAADVMVVPSRLDNLPSTAVESHACGTPVVAFRIGGLPDIIDDGVTGYIVEPFDTKALATSIHSVLSDPKKQKLMGKAARMRATTLWHPRVIAEKYVEVLEQAARDGVIKHKNATSLKR